MDGKSERGFPPIKQSRLDALHGRAQAGDWMDKPVTKRGLIKAAAGAAAIGAAAIFKLTREGSDPASEIKTVKQPQSNSETLKIILPPEHMEAEQKKGNFDDLRAYTDAPFLSYDKETDAWAVSNDPEIITVAMTSHQSQHSDKKLIIFQKGPGEEIGSLRLEEGNEDYNEMKNTKFAVVRLLGSEYGDSDTPGRLTLGEGEWGGAWYAIVGAEEIEKGTLNYFYIDTNGNRLAPGETPVCFQAFYGNKM